jgi:pimeloyl-ACP methyl ester carboxylesterase
MSKPVLVIIPGIGDRSRAYELFAWVWRRRGYEVHVIPFGWSHFYADINTKTQDFLHALDKATEKRKAYIIGVSAGGTAAVHAYAKNQSIQRVVAVCTPFAEFEKIENRLLADSILTARRDLEGFSDDEKAHILTVCGLYDQTVPTWMSKYVGLPKKRIWFVIHAPIIFVALTFASGSLSRFLKR